MCKMGMSRRLRLHEPTLAAAGKNPSEPHPEGANRPVETRNATSSAPIDPTDTVAYSPLRHLGGRERLCEAGGFRARAMVNGNLLTVCPV